MSDGGPTDGATLAEIVSSFERAGFVAQMAPRPGGRVRCLTCRAESDASDVEVHRLRRTEGVSDPDDMLAVAALVCPRCGARGTLALSYGPESDPDDADVLVRLRPVA